MGKFSKFLSALCIPLVLATALTGCSSSSNSNASNGSSAQPKQVTLRFMWWGGDPRHKATLAAVDAYMKKNPNVKINCEYSGYDGYYQKVVTQLTGNTAPDIIQMDWPWVNDILSKGDMFADLYKQKGMTLDGFDKTYLKDYMEYKGALIGMPSGINGLGILYNKALYKKFNIPEDTVWTWDKLVEIGKQVHAQDKDSYLLGGDPLGDSTLVKLYVTQLTGKQWINDDYTPGFDKDSLVKALTFMKKMYDEGVMQPYAERSTFVNKFEQCPKWANNQIVMAVNWSAMVPSYKATKVDVGTSMFPVPAGAKNSGIIVKPPFLYCVNKNSKDVEEAVKFLNWFVNDKEAISAMADNRGVPATDAARKQLNEEKKIDPAITNLVDVSVKNKGLSPNAVTNNEEIKKIVEEHVAKLAYGKTTPEQTADELTTKINSKLQELKK